MTRDSWRKLKSSEIILLADISETRQRRCLVWLRYLTNRIPDYLFTYDFVCLLVSTEDKTREEKCPMWISELWSTINKKFLTEYYRTLGWTACHYYLKWWQLFNENKQKQSNCSHPCVSTNWDSWIPTLNPAFLPPNYLYLAYAAGCFYWKHSNLEWQHTHMLDYK